MMLNSAIVTFLIIVLFALPVTSLVAAIVLIIIKIIERKKEKKNENLDKYKNY